MTEQAAQHDRMNRESRGKGPNERFKVLSELFGRRTDLRGAYAPADYLEEAVRWSA